jgi:hypothetical protein
MSGQSRGSLQEACLLKCTDVVHPLSAARISARSFRERGAVRAFQTLDGSVAIDRDDKSIAETPRPREQIEMAGVKKVETAVGENDLFSGSLEAARLL